MNEVIVAVVVVVVVVVGYVDRSGKVVVPDKPLPLLSTKGSGVSQGSLGTLPVEADSVLLGLAGSASGPLGGSVSVNGVTLTLDAARAAGIPIVMASKQRAKAV